VLVGDFLRLWINAEFANQSATIGKLLAVYLIFQGGFAAIAAYYRGIGKPWFVTIIIFFSLLITALASLFFISSHGPLGVAYAYLAGSASPLVGTIIGGIYAFGASSVPALLRSVVLPLLSGTLACMIGIHFRSYFDDLSWFLLCGNAAVLVGFTGGLVLGVDLILGGSNPPSRRLLARLTSAQVHFRGKRAAGS
jgi:hypothetical protein